MTLPGHKHVSYSTVSTEAREESITFVAPSKTFNMAGLGSSICYCAGEALRREFYSYLDGYGVAGGNIFAFVGAEAAFGEGEAWRQQMLAYLQGNVECLRAFLAERMPAVKAVLPEASYLAWLDFSALGLTHDELADRLVNCARVALNDGTAFGGEAYGQCFRINLGCPRATLTEALERIAGAL
jgi:cystathionine beta-lyase